MLEVRRQWRGGQAASAHAVAMRAQIFAVLKRERLVGPGAFLQARYERGVEGGLGGAAAGSGHGDGGFHRREHVVVRPVQVENLLVLTGGGGGVSPLAGEPGETVPRGGGAMRKNFDLLLGAVELEEEQHRGYAHDIGQDEEVGDGEGRLPSGLQVLDRLCGHLLVSPFRASGCDVGHRHACRRACGAQGGCDARGQLRGPQGRCHVGTL
ncbi:hypothetical protein STTU_5092 [Streptomyces sp. Tu6071]|nr:hypothetical protein STTU_5092 [Streptomyces sp. Tu6071]